MKNEKKQWSPLSYAVVAGTLLVMISAVSMLFYLQPEFEKLHLERLESNWGISLITIGYFLLAIKISFLIYLAVLYFKYKPIKPVNNKELPLATVIVPAYNEGELVYKTLISLANNDYPEDKLELLAIDDGSQDDTWKWMKLAKAELGDRVSIFQQPKNMGKRHALYRGFNIGKGDIFITVDSDSIVETDTLRQMASPFIKDKNCGAVAGNVRVLNNQKAFIPKMLNISFAFSFEFVRSAQSKIGSVLCTPGALAAYRRDAVLACLPQWINQTFMGKASDIGEDRAMTNMILKQGLKVLFQKDAIVYTNIPEKYSTLHKMFTRWERSNVRENIMMSKFAFKNFREGNKTGARILLLNQWINLVMAIPGVLLMLFLLLSQPLLFLSTALTSILVFSSIQVLFYAKKYDYKEALWMYPYSLFYTFSLFWITPYAIATAGRKGWLTRSLPKAKVEKAEPVTAKQADFNFETSI
ncbi:hyaluronan synthase [Mesonia hippocampi]|uniref:Hyaluronan synthase n=1 Tax=Mesonia hippocampi TaxID=1628250 RepID=A0A840ERI5_9FLAO|nr:glycosyltransferase [Mesonia hippocampi]MBB4119651.1 hyaluronan synthase [Mesonia hippocampi]